jgi:predicted amidophosphoribosyltransferase
MTFCPRCQRPIPNDAERPTGNTVYCPHCDALLVRNGAEWVEIEPTP